MTTFGVRLRELRQDKGLTQEELAERAGLSVNAIRALERGRRQKPYPATVRALARALDDNTLVAAGKTPSRRPVPAPARTRLVGREREVDDISRLVADTRLVTLTGPAGVGKTRLALAVAARSGTRFADGVVMVSLAPLRSADQVLLAVSDSLDLPDGTMWPWLRPRRILFVLDNFEHVLDAAADVSRLLDASPGSSVLVTSRAPIRVTGEHVAELAPLGAEAAVELFTERATQAGHTEPLDTDRVRVLCARLDHLPLAIELAAARSRLLTVDSLVTHLDRRFELLVDGARDVPERQRTLRAAMDWSYGLLTPTDQAMLHAVAAFAGGWTLPAAARVAGVPEAEAVASHGRLVAASLVHNRRMRFDLLETVRVYAMDDSYRERHAAWMVDLVEEARTGLEGKGQRHWLDVLHTEHDNLRTTMRWLLDHRRLDTFAVLCGIWQLWAIKGHLAEWQQWIQEALATPEPMSDASRARLLTASVLAGARDDVRTADESITLARRAGDELALHAALALRGYLARAAGDLDHAEDLLTEATELSDKLGLANTTAKGRIALVAIVAARGRCEDADRDVAAIEADLREHGGSWELGLALSYRGYARLVTGDAQRAEEFLYESVATLVEIGDTFAIFHALSMLAVASVLNGKNDQAAQVFGAAAGHRELYGMAFLGDLADNHERALAQAMTALGEDTYELLFRRGQAMMPKEIVTLLAQ